MRAPLAIRALLLAGLAAGASAQTTWYVDAAGAPPGSGTPGDPYVSIQYAIERPTTVDGDRLLVLPGTYAEAVHFQLKSLTVEAAEGPAATFLEPAAPVSGGAPGPASTLRGFTIRANGGPAAAVGIESGLRLERCVVRDAADRAIENNWDLVVRSCTFVDNRGVVIFHYGSGHGSLAVTRVESSAFWNNDMDFDGVGLDQPEFSVVDSVFEDPLFFGPGDHHLQPGSPCIDAGDPDDADPDGTRLDAGAFPFDPNWPLGESYCTPAANSTGSRATMHVSGSASLAANDLVLAALRCPPNASGLFFYGTERAALPFGDGVVCVGGAVARLDPTPTGPGGAPVLALDLASLPGHVPPILPGEERSFSYWFRDVPAGGSGFNFTNAVEVRFEP